MKVNEEGGLEKEYSTEVVYSIPQLTIFNVREEDPRFEPRAPLSLEKKHPPGSPIILLSKKNYGSIGIVGKLAYPENSTIPAALHVKLTQLGGNQPSFHEVLAHNSEDEGPYISLQDAARSLNIPLSLFSRLTASIMVKDSSGDRVNIGLNLKFSKQNQKVLGYTRRKSGNSQGDGKWEFSQKALSLLYDFKLAFPHVLQSLWKNSFADQKTPNYKDIFDSHEDFMNLLNWRKERGIDEYNPFPFINFTKSKRVSEQVNRKQVTKNRK